MAYTYATFTTALATELAISETDADFVTMLPTFIDDAEQRIYRELDLLTASVTLNGTMTPNSRLFTLPSSSGHVLMVDAINVFDGDGLRHPTLPASREVIDFLWPTETSLSAVSLPQFFARIDDTRVLVGPPPGSAFTAEMVGTIRPTPLSAGNTTTFLTQYLSDLFLAGAMCSATGFQRNFGAQSDNPQMAVSWEGVFQNRLASAKAEELRKKFQRDMSTPPMPR